MGKILKTSLEGRICKFLKCSRTLSVYNHQAYCHIHRDTVSQKTLTKIPYHHPAQTDTSKMWRTECGELHAILGVCLEYLMFHEHLGLCVAELPTATSAVEPDFAIEMHFLTATSWAVYILVLRLNHLASLSRTIKCLTSTPFVLSAISEGFVNMGSIPRTKTRIYHN